MEWSLTIMALALIAVAAVSKRLSGSPITPAILFVSIGLLVGPKVLDGVDISSTSSTVRALAEATLALVLFSDASRIDFGELRRGISRAAASARNRPAADDRPRSARRGADLRPADLLARRSSSAVILAPTDAALGQAVVTEPAASRGRIRQGLNIESGLNDGICVPLLFAAVAAADVESHISEGRTGITLLLEEIGYGIVGGVAAGLLIGAIVVYAGRRDLIDGSWRQVIPAAGAALAYGIASALDGSGFIAAFVAGMVFRAVIKRDPEDMNQLTEEVGNVLNGVTFVLFGAILLGPALGELSWELALYAVLSLTVLRMVPVAIAMLGSHARLPTLGFLGWFGPRGLASIVFAVIVIEESALPHEHLMVLAIYLTVGLSVFAHGLTAAPLADRYADWFERHRRDKAADGERPDRGDPDPRLPGTSCEVLLIPAPGPAWPWLQRRAPLVDSRQGRDLRCPISGYG